MVNDTVQESTHALKKNRIDVSGFSNIGLNKKNPNFAVDSKLERVVRPDETEFTRGVLTIVRTAPRMVFCHYL